MALLAAAPGCNCQTDPGPQECSQSVMAQAQSQVDAALSGNQSCTTDADCALVQTPCLIESTCGFDFSAVNLTGEAAVEHAFSVTAAEVCATCTPEPAESDLPQNVECASGTPGAACTAGQCAVVPVLPDGGSFEWACGFGCTVENEYCDVEEETSPCSGDPSFYVLVSDGGTCVEISSSFGGGVGGFCDDDTDCGLGLNCVSSASGNGTCSAACPSGTPQPTACYGGCQLLSNNHGCNICYCPTGCPVFEGEPDGGADAGDGG